MKKQTAFTLIELLVVIAVLALLVAILVPALQTARQRSRAVICLSNEKQWGNFFGLYLNDHKGKFSGLGFHKWMDLLDTYAEQAPKIYFCPSATLQRSEGGQDPFAAWEEDGRRGSYGTNYWVRDEAFPYLPPQNPRDGWWQSVDEKGANRSPLLLDSAWPSGLPLYEDPPPEYDGQISYYAEMKCMRYFCLDRHSGAVNGLFMDLSARKVPLKELWDLQWHRKWNPQQNPPPHWPDWMAEF